MTESGYSIGLNMLLDEAFRYGADDETVSNGLIRGVIVSWQCAAIETMEVNDGQ